MRITIVSILLLLLAAGAEAQNGYRWAPSRCESGLCRPVVTSPLPSPTARLAAALPHGPVATVKRRVADWRWWVVTGVTVGTAIVTTRTIDRCRTDHGIGPCVDGGYGEYRAREALRISLAVGINAVSWPIKKIEDEDGRRFKTWWLLPAGVTAWNASTIARNRARTFGPRETE